MVRFVTLANRAQAFAPNADWKTYPVRLPQAQMQFMRKNDYANSEEQRDGLLGQVRVLSLTVTGQRLPFVNFRIPSWSRGEQNYDCNSTHFANGAKNIPDSRRGGALAEHMLLMAAVLQRQ